MIVYSAKGCPFAHRTRALLDYLERPVELREVDLDDRDPELMRLSPTGRVPFLLDGDFTLYESRAINDYLAEKLGWAGAYSSDLELRALQRLLIAQWDSVVVPAFYRSLRNQGQLGDEQRGSLSKELAWMSKTVDRMQGNVENLAGFHAATHWARMDWLREFTSLPELIEEHPTLAAWLSLAAAQDSIQRTLPGRKETEDRYRRRYVKQEVSSSGT